MASAMAALPALFSSLGGAAAGGASALGAGSALAGAAAPAAGAATGVGSALGGGSGLGSLMSVVPEMGGALGGGEDALGSLMNMMGGTPGGGGADIGQSAPMKSLFGQESSIPGQPSMAGAQLLPDMNDPKKLIGGDLTQIIDPYEALQEDGKWNNKALSSAFPEQYIARSNEFADRGLEYNQAPEAGASSMDLKGLMDMMQGSMPSQGGGGQQSPGQVPAYMNKYIQGLMGGM